MASVNAEISVVFNKIADLLEIKGDNPFRIRAYRNAAASIEMFGKDVSVLSSDELVEIPGIGKDLAAKIGEFIKTGHIEMLEKLKLEFPEGLISLLNVPGVGPKTAGLIYKKYHIDNIDDLEKTARKHKLASIPGIRDKTEANILRGIQMLKRVKERHPLGRVLPLANNIVAYLSANARVRQISIAGSIRRWKETINDIDIISTSEKPRMAMNVFTGMPGVREVLMKGPTKSSVLLEEGIQADLRVVDEDSFGAALLYFTGSKSHNIRLRELALRSGMKINEYGIFSEKKGEKLGGKSEGDIYRVLGLQYIPPEMREDRGEIDAAASGVLPHLVEIRDIRGDLHIHTDWSDGKDGIEDIVNEAVKKGYRYMAITDHSKGLGIAGGLSAERLQEQRKLIDAINRKQKRIRLLAGVEVNIMTDGSLDMGLEVLQKLDIVIASVHSGFSQSREQITGRIVTAMRNPLVSVICHPTGRLIGEREGYEIEMDEILRVAAETGTAIEINAFPMRLDLQDTYVRSAKMLGVPLVISTDSHHTGQFDNMVFGVSVARRGWLERSDVLNTLDHGRLIKWLKHKRSSV